MYVMCVCNVMCVRTVRMCVCISCMHVMHACTLCMYACMYATYVMYVCVQCMHVCDVMFVRDVM